MNPSFPAVRIFGPAVAAAVAVIAILPAPALAEKADKDKPTNIESNRMSSDDARRISIFEGNVVLTKGTILVRADRITVRQDPEGFQISVATGNPARFRQKRDGKDEWIDGDALTIEIDDKKEKIDLREQARVLRDKDEVRGDVISVDQRSEFFSVLSGKSVATASNPEGRVRAVIQPKAKPDEPVAAPPPGAKGPATLPPAAPKTQAR